MPGYGFSGNLLLSFLPREGNYENCIWGSLSWEEYIEQILKEETLELGGYYYTNKVWRDNSLGELVTAENTKNMVMLYSFAKSLMNHLTQSSQYPYVTGTIISPY